MQHGMRGMGRMMDGYPYEWAYIGLLLLALLILVIFILVRCSAPERGGGARAEDSPLDILKKRYARGEITKEEFEGFKRDLDL